MGTKKSKIGENGYHLVEEKMYGDEETFVTLMYKDWYVLRFSKGMIELATSIEGEKQFKVDKRGRILISKKTC